MKENNTKTTSKTIIPGVLNFNWATNNENLVLTGLVLLAAFSRLIPHAPNFTAIGGMALFSGAFFSSRRLALVVPLMALFLSDLAIGFHETMWAVYLAFSVIVFLGFIFAKSASKLKVLQLSLASSGVFFLISNLGVWVSSGMYPKSWLGLIECFVMAVPFFGHQVAGDLISTALLFSVYAIIQKQVLSTQTL